MKERAKHTSGYHLEIDCHDAGCAAGQMGLPLTVRVEALRCGFIQVLDASTLQSIGPRRGLLFCDIHEPDEWLEW